MRRRTEPLAACPNMLLAVCVCVPAHAQLVDEARRRWLNEEDGVVDDITAVVVRLHHRQQGQQGPGSSGNAVQQTE